jgi:hypothetical protein
MYDPDLSIGVITFLAALFALAEASRRYNRRCQERFGVEPLRMDAIVWWAVLIALIYYSDALRSLMAATGHDVSNLFFLMGLGVAGVIASLIRNVWRTNGVYGGTGTALKFACGLLLFLFAHYTVVGWVVLPVLLFGDHSPRPGRPRIPQPDEAHWNDPRWRDPRWDNPRWANLYWDDPRWGVLPWNDPRWDNPEWKHPGCP